MLRFGLPIAGQSTTRSIAITLFANQNMKQRQMQKPVPANRPPTYLPFCNRLYDVKPNLYKLGHDFGNGSMDSRVLQIDCQAGEYRQQKLAARKRDLDRYYRDNLQQTDPAGRSLLSLLATQMCHDYPELFTRETWADGWQLNCAMTGESLQFDDENFFVATTVEKDLQPNYQSGLDALACQLQEDICVIRKQDDGDSLVAAHLCFPNRWSLSEKIGKNFTDIHRPVAGFLQENRNPSAIMKAITGRRPYVRFAWGLSSDSLLDHHPTTAGPIRFTVDTDPLFVRVERQTLLGVPDTDLVLFFIRTYYYDCHTLCDQTNIVRQLLASLRSMNADTLKYKGLNDCIGQIVQWLQRHAD